MRLKLDRKKALEGGAGVIKGDISRADGGFIIFIVGREVCWSIMQTREWP
jgi:hypothetical protein